MKKFCVLFTFVVITICSATIKSENTKILKIDIKKEIGSTTWLYIKNGFAEADIKKADIVLIHLNTYGGELVYADSIRTKILNYEKPVYVFVDNNAASAGALIALSCDKIFMRPGANMGAATVVDGEGKQMPDKYQSYMRSIMRSTAESHGKDILISGNDTTYRWKRDPLIAEAMVDDRTVVPGLIDSGKTLTFTAQEAIKYNYCEGLANNVTEVIEDNLKINQYDLETYRPTAWENIKGFLMSSVLQGILIMLIIGGIYFELQSPGIGFPLVVAITAAVLYFAPLYIDGLASYWEIMVFIIGLILIALELLVIPGFGIAGVSGIILVIVGLTLSLLNNVDFNFGPVRYPEVSKALLTVMGGIFFGFIAIIYFSSKIGTKGLFRKVALNTSLDNESGYIGVPIENKELIGESGIATTVLRPAGKVSVKGVVYDAVALNGYIEKGTKVKVVKYETGQIYVVEE